jgi:signal transduction histidine kinase
VLFPARTADRGDAASGFPTELRVLGAGADEVFHALAEWRQPLGEAVFDPPFLRLPLATARIRRLRLEVRGGQPRGRGRFFALGEVVLLAGGANLALGAPVRASEGILNPPRWQPENLTDGFLWFGNLQGGRVASANGFHSRIESSPEAVPKWVEVDLGAEAAIDEVRLVPARPVDFADVAGFGFPPRYRVELVPETGAAFTLHAALDDSPNPGDAAACLPAGGRSARRVRVTAEQLWRRSGDYIFALAELQVWAGGRNLALGREVACSDQVSASSWSSQALVDGHDSRRELLAWPEWLEQASQRLQVVHSLAAARQRLAMLDRERQRAMVRSLGAGAGTLLLVAAALLGWMYQRQKLARQRLRERLARDLHDEVGSQLSHLSLLAGQGDAAALPKIAAGARELQQVMRDLVWLLAPGGGDARDFTARLRATARQWLEPAVTEVAVETVGVPPEGHLPLDWAREVLLFVREALTNAARHSRAQRVSVRQEWRPDAFVWILQDDGVGFDEQAADFAAGSGLGNLRHRAGVLQGRVVITARPGAGTRLELICPPPHGPLAH